MSSDQLGEVVSLVYKIFFTKYYIVAKITFN